MSKYQKETENIDREAIFRAETPQHIFYAIETMENEVFKLKIGLDLVINNYWRLKFTLYIEMHEREIFGEMVKIIVIMFKEDAEINLGHMQDVFSFSSHLFSANREPK